MEGRGGCDHVCGAQVQGNGCPRGRETGHGRGKQQQQQGAGRQRGIENVLAQATEGSLHYNDGKHRTYRRHPIGHGGRERQRQQQPRDGGREIFHGLVPAGKLAPERLGQSCGRNGYRRKQQAAEPEEDRSRQEGGQQRDQNVQHDPPGVVAAADMRG